MSRSFGWTSVTSRPAISIRPPSSGSRPASIRSAVVLPEPDGPTRTMNSPSWMLRSSASTAGLAPLAYTRLAWRKFTAAMTNPLSLDRAHGQAAHQRALRDPADDDHRHRGDRRRRAQVRDVEPFLRDGADQEHRHGRRVRDGEVERQEQLVPGEDDADQRGGHQARGHHWHDDLDDLPDPARAIEPGRLEHLARHLE